MQYTDQQLLTQLRKADGFNGFPNGPLDIWIRSKGDVFNRFDDCVYTYDCSGTTPVFIMKCSGTSNAGAYGLLHFARYNSKGCAILKSNQIVYLSHIYGLHKGEYPAYVQNKPFPYYRDNDMDKRADETGPIYTDIIGANCHKAGWASTIINNWSVACLVRNVEVEFNHWMQFMNKRPLTVAILREF